MIVECKNCLKKFAVKDSDIPAIGRTVQCGNCSTQWLQMPIHTSTTSDNLDIDADSNQGLSEDGFTASDGKKYKFLGSQWAEILPSGKSGRLARKKISQELNELSGKKQVKKIKIIKKSKLPENQYQEKQNSNRYHEKQNNGMGIFSFFIVSAISIAALILLLDTFRNQLIPFFPKLDDYLVYIFETLNNIYIIIKDLINNYK